jgi:Zn-dependent protease
MATFEAAYQLLLSPPRVRAGALVLLGSLVLFLVAGAIRDGDWRYTILLVIVILIHELGHYAGMRWFGYEDVQMFFIPLVGAAVSGRPKATAAWKDGIVTLLGPLPGIALGVVLTVWMAARSEVHPSLSEFASLLVAINLFNLLPIGPLDGGRLYQRTLFSRSFVLEVGFGAISGTLLMLFGLWQTSMLLVMLGGFTLVALVPRYHAVSAARWLRSTNPGLPSDPAALDPDQRFALFTAARTTVRDADNADPQRLAGAMRHLLDSLQARPSFAATISLLAAWAAGVVTALAAGFMLVAATPPNGLATNVQTSAWAPSFRLNLPACRSRSWRRRSAIATVVAAWQFTAARRSTASR